MNIRTKQILPLTVLIIFAGSHLVLAGENLSPPPLVQARTDDPTNAGNQDRSREAVTPDAQPDAQLGETSSGPEQKQVPQPSGEIQTNTPEQSPQHSFGQKGGVGKDRQMKPTGHDEERQMTSAEAEGNVAVRLNYKAHGIDWGGIGEHVAFGVFTFGIGLIPGVNEEGNNGYTALFDKSKKVNAHFSIAVNSYGEGRVMVFLAPEGEKRCAPFQLQLVGFQTASNVYELRTYIQNQNVSTKVGSADGGSTGGEIQIGTPIGMMNITSDKVFVSATHDLSFVTPGGHGDCVWFLPTATAINLKRKK